MHVSRSTLPNASIHRALRDLITSFLVPTIDEFINRELISCARAVVSGFEETPRVSREVLSRGIGRTIPRARRSERARRKCNSDGLGRGDLSERVEYHGGICGTCGWSLLRKPYDATAAAARREPVSECSVPRRAALCCPRTRASSPGEAGHRRERCNLRQWGSSITYTLSKGARGERDSWRDAPKFLP